MDPLQKRDVFHDGVWCIADMGTTAYVAAKKQSQAAVAWADQALYGHNTVYFCAVVVVVFIAKRLVYFLVDNAARTTKTTAGRPAETCYCKLAALNRWVCYRRLPTMLCSLFQLPSSLGNFLLIAGGSLYVLCYTFIPKFWYRECRGFGSPPLAVRAGMQATALVPFLFILSGKTNLISQLTDISYEKLNVYHRWVSVICCLLGWTHTIPFYVQAVREGGRARLAWFQSHEDLFRNGIPPLVFLTILTVFSHSYIRAAWYELWLQVHWICALGFYISLFYHCYPEMNSWKYMIATAVFWVAQLGWRAVNKALLRPNRDFLRPNKCRMRRFTSNGPEEHYFEVVIENSNDFSWVPGQHVFLRIPGLRFLESHPFSIISHFEPRQDTDIRLVVKACGWGGLTDHIYQKLPDSGFSDSTVFIDGPYGGCSRRVDAFHGVFLLASGTGVSAVLPFLEESCRQLKNPDALTSAVNFSWIVRSSDNIEWVLPELKKIVHAHSGAIKEKKVVITIYISQEIGLSCEEPLQVLKHNMNSSSDSEPDDKDDHFTEASPVPATSPAPVAATLQLGLINITNSKPEVNQLVTDTGVSLLEKNIFIVSGSDSMKVQASNAVAALQRHVLRRQSPIREIYLHSESFGW